MRQLGARRRELRDACPCVRADRPQRSCVRRFVRANACALASRLAAEVASSRRQAAEVSTLRRPMAAACSVSTGHVEAEQPMLEPEFVLAEVRVDEHSRVAPEVEHYASVRTAEKSTAKLGLQAAMMLVLGVQAEADGLSGAVEAACDSVPPKAQQQMSVQAQVLQVQVQVPPLRELVLPLHGRAAANLPLL